MAEFASPSELQSYVLRLADDLEAAGHASDSDRLRRVATAAYTTGSEWLGDMGLLIRELERTGSVPPELAPRFRRIMSAVHDVWPRL